MTIVNTRFIVLYNSLIILVVYYITYDWIDHFPNNNNRKIIELHSSVAKFVSISVFK